MKRGPFPIVVALWLASAAWSVPQAANQADTRGSAPAAASAEAAANRAAVDRYCVGCHNERTKTAGLTLDSADLANVPEGAEVWEKVVRKLRAGTMPPQGARRPDEATAHVLLASLERELDRAAAVEARIRAGRCFIG